MYINVGVQRKGSFIYDEKRKRTLKLTIGEIIVCTFFERVDV